MSALLCSKPLYKARLGHSESHSFGKRETESQVLLKQIISCLQKQFCVPVFPFGTMWKAVVLAVCVLVAGVQPMDDPSYGVKLCGREFIRAVIFTCGGSRWKRSLRSAESSEDPFSSRPDESSEGVSHNFVVDRLLLGTRDLSKPKDGQEEVFSRTARSFITEEILEALRKADRKARDVVVGLSNACCKWGCSKSEISSLC